jgi:hypothetical protein
MAYAALFILLESLEQLSAPNKCFVHVKSEKLESPTKNLKFLKDFLENSTYKCYDKEMMKSIEGKIRKVVYKTQNVIEGFVFVNPCRSQDFRMDIFDKKCSIHQNFEQILQEIGSLKAEAIKLGETTSMEDTNAKVINDLMEIPPS